MLVVGAPTHVHGLPSSMSRKTIEAAAEDAEAKGKPLDYRPTAGIRTFLDRLPEADGAAAACFDTRFDKSRILTGSRRASSSWTPKGPSRTVNSTGPVDGEHLWGPQLA